MKDDLLKVANMYADGLKRVESRRDQWLQKYKELKDHLTEMALYLNTNTAYKQGFFVDTLHAFNEEINGTSANMPSVTFRSGEMPMNVTFKNNMGERKSFVEEGFHISFNPIITGQAIVLLTPHHSELDKNPPGYATLAVIDEPAQLTMDIVDQIIAKGMEAAFYSSFTGMNSSIASQNEEDMSKPPVAHSPIGFKLHDTTEKVK